MYIPTGLCGKSVTRRFPLISVTVVTTFFSSSDKNPHFRCRQLKFLSLTEVKTLVSMYELVCHLVHLNEQFLSQFCDSVEILGTTDLLVGFISQGNDQNF